MAPKTTSASHGFLEALLLDDTADTSEAFGPEQFKDREVFRRLWKYAFGRKEPMYQRIYVIGDRAALDKWSPYRDKGYPSFIQTLEYKGPPQDVDGGDGSEMAQALLTIKHRDCVLLLPGEYDRRYLWDRTFTGTNIVSAVFHGDTLPDDTCVYNALMDAGPIVDCTGKTFIAGIRILPKVCAYESLVSVSGTLRLFCCPVGPNFDDADRNVFRVTAVETSDLVKVKHGASLLSQWTRFGPSTRSLIECEGQCTVVLSESQLVSSGVGDRVQRTSKATGKFPRTLPGARPAIAVSYAAIIHLKRCTFEGNYGYPVQYASRAEQNVQPSFARSFGYDLTNNEGKMELEELAKHQLENTPVSLKCTKGSVTIVDTKKLVEVEDRMSGVSRTRRTKNAISPLLPDLPDDYAITLEPWFSPDSKLMELVDAENGTEPIERWYQHCEAVDDRAAWHRVMDLSNSSPAAIQFRSLVDSGTLIEMLVESFNMIASDPFMFFRVVRTDKDMVMGTTFDQVDEEKDRDEWAWYLKLKHLIDRTRTAFGLMSDEGTASLRQSMRDIVDETFMDIRTAVGTLTESPEVEELSRICWGRLASENGSRGSFHVAQASLVALYANASSNVSPYRAEVLVEQIQCDYDKATVSSNEKCACRGDAASAQAAAFLLGLSHESVVNALLNLLKNLGASDHGRKNAGDVLMRIAFAVPDHRERVVEALSAAIGDESKLSLDSRESLVSYLGCLHAAESHEVVREVFLSGALKDSVDGYIHYLRLVGLPVDPTDDVVAREVDKQLLASNLVVGKQNRIAHASQVRKEVKKHNTLLRRRSPCDRCGKHPPKDESFPVCVGCCTVCYCSTGCQWAAWKEHKKVCKPRQKGMSNN